MDRNRLLELAWQFKDEQKTSADLASHLAEHERRIERARKLLTLERIPSLAVEELSELIRGTDGWKNFLRGKALKLDQFLGDRDPITKALLRLIEAAEVDLSSEDFKNGFQVFGKLTSELLALRFPERYWIWNSPIEDFLKKAGMDPRSDLPRGQKNEENVYFAAGRKLDEICQALREAGCENVNYMLADVFIWWAKDRIDGGISEIERYFSSKGLHFTPEQLTTFYTALKTKGFVILTGISGTGKTKLAQHFAELLGSKDQFYFAAVRPDWRDSKSLLGYFNPLLGEKGQFQSTDFLRFILRAKAEYDQRGKDAFPHFVLLDEMNLAKVEYYFADFLSVLESGRRQDRFTKEAIRFQYPEGIDGPPRELYLPPNLYFIGTVNVDETTYMFSPKVLDRAFTLELGTVNLEDYPGGQGELLSEEALEQLRAQLLPDFTRQGQFAVIDKARVAEFAATHDTYHQHLSTLNTLLEPHDLHFGYRVFDEIVMFLANAEGSPVFDGFGPDGLDAAFDAAVLMKVLPKFHGTRGKLREPLEKIAWWAREPENPEAGRQALSGKLQNTEGIVSLREDLRRRIGVGTTGESSAADFAYPRTALKALRMLHDLHTTGFASFA